MSEFYKTFNQYLNDKEMEAIKALDSTRGEPLNPEVKSDILVEYVKAIEPLVAILQQEVYQGRYYEFERITSLASEISAINGENAVVAEDDGVTYTPVQLNAKEFKRISGVTHRQREEDGTKGRKSFTGEVTAKARALALEFGLSAIWGEGVADTYQMDGILSQIGSTSLTSVAGSLTQRILDDSLAEVSESATDQTWAWLTSPQMGRGISRLGKDQVYVIRDATKLRLPGGYTFSHYGEVHDKAIPIIPTSFLKVPGTMSTPTPTLVSGGSLADATTYYYKIAAIVSKPDGDSGYAKGGETYASAEVSQATSSPNLSVKLDWTAFPAAISYVIYRSTSTGTETRLKVIPARTYDADGTPTGTVTTWTDDGTYTPDGYYKPLLTDEEVMILLPLNKKAIHWLRLNSDANMNKLITYQDIAPDETYKQKFRMHSFLNIAVRDAILTKVIRNVELPS